MEWNAQAELSGALVQRLVHGRWKAEVLRTVLQLDLAGELGDGSATAGELAVRLRLSEDALHRLLTLAAEIGLFSRTEAGAFTNNAASSLLRAGRPGSMRTEAAHILAGWAAIAWDNLEYSVRHGTSGFRHATGGSVFEFLQAHAADARAFHDFQAHVTRRNTALLAAQVALPPGGTIVDVGGGSGAILTEILQRQAALRGIVYDLPEVIAAARGVPRPAGLRGRLEFAAGDFFQAVPAGAVMYVLSHILHDWPDERAVVILRRVAEAMGESSELLIMENVLPPAGAGMLLGYLDVLMLTGWGGRERTLGAYRELLGSAGLRLTQSWTLEPRSGLTAIGARRVDAA